jgi:hypothetical protein
MADLTIPRIAPKRGKIIRRGLISTANYFAVVLQRPDQALPQVKGKGCRYPRTAIVPRLVLIRIMDEPLFPLIRRKDPFVAARPSLDNPELPFCTKRSTVMLADGPIASFVPSSNKNSPAPVLFVDSLSMKKIGSWGRSVFLP